MALRELQIRNTHNGCIWQVYHVRNQTEVDMLSATAHANGFQSCKVIPWLENEEESWPGWRDTEAWKSRIADVTMPEDFPEVADDRL